MNAHLCQSLLGLAAASTLAGRVLWLLHAPRPVPVEAAHAILVPITGSGFDRREVELGCQLAVEHQASVVLMYVIDVPLTLPLGAPLEQAERDAQQALESARALVAGHGLPVRTVVRRDRGVREALAAETRKYQLDLTASTRARGNA